MERGFGRIFRGVGRGLTQSGGEIFAETGRGGAEVELAACELHERHRIRGVAPEFPLVDVQPHADARVVDARPDQGVFYQYAADLPVAGIDVVGPFHHAVGSFRSEEIADGERSGLADQKLSGGRHLLRLVEKGESEVAARLGLPAVAPLAATRGLGIGKDHRHVVELRGVNGRIAVGGADLFKQQKFHESSVIVRDPSGLTVILTWSVSSGRKASTFSGHSIRQREPE